MTQRLPILVAIVLVGVMLSLGALPTLRAERSERRAEPTLPATPYDYHTESFPPYFAQLPPGTDNTPTNNPITDEGATLGRVLFYDTRLSANDTVSCASCHIQANGFSDPRPLSIGFEGGFTGRNSMGLANARYYGNRAFFWDERAATLEDQVLMPIQDGVEMGMTLPALEQKLAATPYYAPLFQAAFGTPEVTSERISLALAQFVRAMTSYQSRFDEGLATRFANFTPQELQGRDLFMGRARCLVCHTTELQIATRARHNGLDATTTDLGLAAVTGNAQDEGKFKVPSLRNIALTGPYMHDGRFATLEEVVAFYNNQVQPHPNLDPALRTPDGSPRRLNLDRGERAALVAFLETLTDESLASDVRFSDPFEVTLGQHTLYLPLATR